MTDEHVFEDTVRHVLFDADEVMQQMPGGWYAAMEPYVGDRAREFLHQTWKDELPTLTGIGDYLPMLEATLRRYGVKEPVDVVFADVWHRIEVSGESVQLVRALRARGYGVHLATNQERHRGDFMKQQLRYEELFDVQCYSYELGVAKPDTAFFDRAAQLIGAPPQTILLIDDNERNVEGARTAGLRAERWQLSDGHADLVDLLSGYGIRATSRDRLDVETGG